MSRWASAAAAVLLAPGLLATLDARAEGFQVQPPQVESRVLRAEAERLGRMALLENAVAALNAQLRLPRNVSVRLVECGESNAYYDPEAYEIQMCLELMEDMAGVLDGQFEDESVESDALTGAWMGTLLHEVGHALVHVLDLPITGREEDVVDQLSAWMLISAGDADAVLGYAATYYTESGEVGAADFAGVHALNEQRYFNLLCWAYGSDPEAAEELTASWELPSERAELCADEYAQMDRAWSRLLGPHLRQPMSQLALARPGAVGILFGEGGDVEASASAIEPGDSSGTASTGGKDFADEVSRSAPTGKGEPDSLGKLQKINDDLPPARGEGARRGINSRDEEG
ncbi:DUF4344 domain-containing metallopeptidase [Aquimonas voraii]|uniref:Putative metallopeptidase n=1 Tax=Aquimonas voraii TaxID=265719 RepID=A0A1G6UV77_9GAMM|nr:DUF4344 domain-containing metallopeptidase [Aquimonas voraii]SDD44465.1 Putative metallopeptidase [Aquimonas voraii]